MNRYDSYKNSGVKWIGNIPSKWESNKIKYLFREKKSTPNPNLNSGSISFGKVVYKDDESIPESTKNSYQEVLEGEFLINPLNLNYDLKSLRIGLSKLNVVVSQGYIVLIINQNLNSEYYNYLLHIFDIQHMKSLGQGVRQTISFTHLKEELLPLPPLSEQQEIVSYLDNKTSSIDSLIQSKEKKIELLKEKRTSLINQVVTKGLNPDVEMKDSGVEWIGEIPREWKKTKIKYLISKKPDNGLFKKREEFGDGIPFINVSDLFSNDGIIDENKLELVRVTPKEIDKSLVMDGDIFFVRSSLKLEGIGVSSIYLGGSVLVFDCHIIRVTPNKVLVNPKFLIFLLNSRIYRNSLVSLSETVTMTTISQDKIKDLVVCIPPLNEQHQIVQYLDKETKLIDETISSEQKKIELLKEYKQSLISEVVTGKRKVTTDD